MREAIVKFKCDVCGREVTKSATEDNVEDLFPYRDGWLNLESLSLSVPKKSVHSVVKQPAVVDIEGKDFCSRECMFAMIVGSMDVSSDICGDDVPKPMDNYPKSESFGGSGFVKQEAQFPQVDEFERTRSPRFDDVDEPKVSKNVPLKKKRVPFWKKKK